MNELNKLLKVDYTLEEISQYVLDKVNKGDCISQSSSTPRKVNKYGEDKILKASFQLVGKNITSEANVKSYIAFTKDNYLVYTTIIEDSYGLEDKSKYFGLCNQFFSAKAENLFLMLPESLQNEVIATQWLAHNPKNLGDKVNQVLSVASKCLEEKDKVIDTAQDMLVNAHHNMKKSPKELFTRSWLGGEYFEKVIKCMPWFKSCLEKGE